MILNIYVFIVVCLVASILAFFAGKRAVKFIMLRNDKELIKKANEIAEGNRKNETEIDGKMIEVKYFKLRDDDNVEKIVDLFGKPMGVKNNG